MNTPNPANIGKVKPRPYIRKNFPVVAVQVNAGNMTQIAEWCGGIIKVSPANERYPESEYVFIEAYRPTHDRQTRAYVGDWIVKSEKGYRVFNHRAFKDNFERQYETQTDDD